MQSEPAPARLAGKQPREKMNTYSISYHMPYPQPLIMRHYLLAVRSKVEASNKDEAKDILIARHMDRLGNAPHVIAIVEVTP